MADDISRQGGAPGDGAGGVLSAEQRATFRSAGFWMAIIGWAEVLFGVGAALLWLLAALGTIAEEVLGGTGQERRLLVLQGIGSVAIGVLTLVAARSFRRAGLDPSAGLPAVTAAVADLAELYERQVWFAALLLVLAVGGAVVGWW